LEQLIKSAEMDNNEEEEDVGDMEYVDETESP